METKEFRDSIMFLEQARQELIEKRNDGMKKSKEVQDKAKEFTGFVDEEISREINPRIEALDIAILSIRRRLRGLEESDDGGQQMTASTPKQDGPDKRYSR